jgi:NAD(P)H-dependent flavin oxidoreductase YrpB (nitropropane dioxygenase family)
VPGLLRTRFTEEYGVSLPIVSAGMAFVARARLVTAVARAGGLGVLGATAMPPELLAKELEEVRAHTDRPFGVNIIPRFGTDAHIEECVKQRVPVVVFFWDPPPPVWIGAIHDGGGKVWLQAGSVEEAQAAVDSGADAVIAQGVEAGGHNRSRAGTIALVPSVVDAIAPTLVLAAGGIADGRGLVAALALGAGAAVLGTRFVASEEGDAHAEYKRRIVSAPVDDTARHNIFGFDFPDATARGLRNAIVREWEGRDDPAPYASLDPAQQPVIGEASVYGEPMPVPRFVGLPPTRDATGDLDQMSLLAGESTGLIADVRPAADLVREIGREAEQIIAALG